MRVEGTDIFITRGDTEIIKIIITDQDGDPYPLVEGDKIYFTIKENTHTTNKMFQKVITHFDKGIAHIILEPKDTSSWAYGKYKYDMQMVGSSGTTKTIIKPSNFTVEKEVTYEY